MPEHLREDFCGTALISATWCRGDCRRTAIGLDIDRQALEWGLDHNGGSLIDESRPRLCLFQGDVCDPLDAAVSVRPPAASADDTVDSMTHLTLRAEAHGIGAGSLGDAGETGPPAGNRSGDNVAQGKSRDAAMMQSSSKRHEGNDDEDEEADGDGGSCAAKPVDITCALNFSVCLLHQRSDVVVRIFPLSLPALLQCMLLRLQAAEHAVGDSGAQVLLCVRPGCQHSTATQLRMHQHMHLH